MRSKTEGYINVTFDALWLWMRYGQNKFIAFTSRQSVHQVIMTNIICWKISQPIITAVCSVLGTPHSAWSVNWRIYFEQRKCAYAPRRRTCGQPFSL